MHFEVMHYHALWKWSRHAYMHHLLLSYQVHIALIL